MTANWWRSQFLVSLHVCQLLPACEIWFQQITGINLWIYIIGVLLSFLRHFFNRDFRAPTQKKEINSIVPSLPDILLGWRNDSSEINSSSITLQIYKKKTSITSRVRNRAQQECHCCFLHYVGRLNLSCVCVFEVNGQALVRTVQCLPYIKSDQTHG